MVAQLAPDFPGYEIFNVATIGANIASISTEYATQVASLFDGLASQNILVLRIGANDIPLLVSRQANYAAYCSTAQATGWKIVVVPVLYSAFLNGAAIADVDAFNAWLVANFSTFANAYADILAVPEAMDPFDPVYFPDGIHPSPALHALTTPVISAAISSIL